jgi:transposase
MIDLKHIENIYIVPGYTDMRKQMDGLLSVLTVHDPHIDLTTHNLYLFCSKNRVNLKVLEIDDDGIWVYYKRTHGDQYLWPKNKDHQIIDQSRFHWLLDGLSIIYKWLNKNHYYLDIYNRLQL